MSTPPGDDGRRFLNLSAGALAVVIAVVIVLPIVVCLGMCFLGSVGAAVDPT